MVPVTQRIEGYPYGECVRASYATILGLPIEAVPRLDPAAAGDAGEGQRALERRYLASIGLRLIEIRADPPKEIPDWLLGAFPEDMPHLISGRSPRGTFHRCVGVGGRVAWDPHPSRAGLVAVHSVGILVPKW
jgi:hypothetical protein